LAIFFIKKPPQAALGDFQKNYQLRPFTLSLSKGFDRLSPNGGKD
jgi:hypothetical protein